LRATDRPARLLGVTICAVASFAILAHHAAPSLDRHGPANMTETCVSVAAQTIGHLAAPAALLLTFAAALLPVAATLSTLARRPAGRARAAPAELRIPLRC